MGVVHDGDQVWRAWSSVAGAAVAGHATTRLSRVHVVSPQVLLRSAGAVAAATLLAASAEPLGWWAAAPAGAGVLAVCVHGAGGRLGSLLGFVTGTAWSVLLVPWLAAVGLSAWVVTSVAVGVFVGLTGAAMSLVARWPGWPVWVAVVWVLGEEVWSRVPLGGFPWPRLAWSAVDAPWAGWLALVGVPGTSMVVFLSGSFAAWVATMTVRRLRCPLRRPRARAAGALGTAGVSATLLSAPLLWPPASLGSGWVADAETFTVAVVQGGVPGDGTQLAAHHREVTDRLAEATVGIGRTGGTVRPVADGGVPIAPDLVLWPENSTAVDPGADADVRADLVRASAAVDAPVLVGTIEDGPRTGTAVNLTRVWRDGHDVGRAYVKRHLVPFGEYVPWRDLFRTLGVGRVDEVPRDMLPGGDQGPFGVAGTHVGLLICFDVAHDDAVRAAIDGGAELLAVQTSNATFTGTRQLNQQLVITRARALETGRAVVVAATTGVSAVIAPDGSVVSRSEDSGRAVLVEDVPLVRDKTAAAAAGPLVVPSAAALLSLSALWRRARVARLGRTSRVRRPRASR